MMRQKHKQTSTIIAAGALLASLAAASCAPALADGLVPSIVTDPLTGVAIDGMDPVSYFTGPEPLPGKPDYEYDWQGVPWYFANPANRDVFIRAPQVYAPQFGGHAVMSLADGYFSDGNPDVYAVVAGRLYLFYSAETRTRFDAAPAQALAAARTRWAELTKMPWLGGAAK